MIRLFIGLIITSASLGAATKYVDNSLGTGSNNGTSWANAWHSLTGMTGLVSDDIVEISGGSTGNSQTYTFAGGFEELAGYAEGTAGHPITYRIGQDSSHNGTAIFKQTSVGGSNFNFIYGASNVIFSGDAGDGAKHFAMDPTGTSNTLCALFSPNVNVRFSYWELGTYGEVADINGANGVELDHIHIKISFNTANRAVYFNVNGSTWDENKIHDCNFELPYNPNTSNNGPDGIQGGGIGYSIYNNVFSSFIDIAMTGSTQHMDGIQAQGGNYIKAYNNRFCNMSNYGMYWEATAAVFNHLWVYNNVISTDTSAFGGGAGSNGGIVVEQKVAGTMNDVALINNTLVDLKPPGDRPLTFLTTFTGSFPATNSIVANNILVNSNGYESDAGAPTDIDTVAVTQTNAATYFTSYTYLGGNSNVMSLTSSATPLIGQGATESGYFTTDITGATRTVPWDVGAYKYTGASGGGGSYLFGAITLKGGVVLH